MYRTARHCFDVHYSTHSDLPQYQILFTTFKKNCSSCAFRILNRLSPVLDPTLIKEQCHSYPLLSSTYLRIMLHCSFTATSGVLFISIFTLNRTASLMWAYVCQSLFKKKLPNYLFLLRLGWRAFCYTGKLPLLYASGDWYHILVSKTCSRKKTIFISVLHRLWA